MSTADLDEAVSAGQRITDAELDDAKLGEDFDELRVALVNDSADLHNWRFSGSRLRWLVAAVAAMAVVVGVGVITTVFDRNDSASAYSAELVSFAERSPMLLIDSSEWPVTRADERGDGRGEMTFGDPRSGADLRWNYEDLPSLIEDRLWGNEDMGMATVLGSNARVTRYDGTTEFAAMWEHDGQTLEFRAAQPSFEEFAELLDSLSAVDVESWLDAMPPSVIDAVEKPSAIEDILEGVSLPDGFDAASIEPSSGVSDRYQLIAKVTGAVACDWLDDWISATERGDSEAAAEAAAGLATSRQWPALLEIESQGGWSDAVWEYADAVNGGPGVPTGLGPQAPSREIAAAGLGCRFN